MALGFGVLALVVAVELVPLGALVVKMNGAGVNSTVVVVVVGVVVVIVVAGAGLVVCFFLRHAGTSEASLRTASDRTPIKKSAIKLEFFIAAFEGRSREMGVERPFSYRSFYWPGLCEW